MEFTNEIFFNKPLSAGNTVIITYSGKLYREHSKDVTIVYGYGDNWEYTDSAQMVETENGFEVTLTMKDYNIFNFCFTNSFNIWDNNSGCNYIAPIFPKQDIELDNNITDNSEETSTKIQDEVDINKEDENTEDEEQKDTDEEAQENSEDNDQKEIETAFAALLDSLLDSTKNEETINISELDGFGLQSVDTIKEEDMINCDEIFSQLFDELTSDEETINTSSDFENDATENIEKDEISDDEELDNLMDNLLTSISEKAEAPELASPIQEIEVNDEENYNLPAIQEEKEDFLDKFINISYNFAQKVTKACKKLGDLIKLKAKEYGFIHDEK